ncbi:MAG: hypothetical protein ACREJB_03135, partial [Planctomycetaceae bacterium]
MAEQDRENVQQIRERVMRMARQIDELSQSNVPPQFFFHEFLNRIVSALGGRAGAVWMRRGPQIELVSDVRLAEIGFFEKPDAKPLNDKILANVLSTGEAVGYHPADPQDTPLPTDHLIIVAALQKGSECVGAVEVFQRYRAEPFRALLNRWGGAYVAFNGIVAAAAFWVATEAEG